MASDFAIYLLTLSAVKLGHVARLFFLIAQSNVELTGMKRASVKNSSISPTLPSGISTLT